MRTNKKLEVKAYLNVNFELCIEEFKCSPEEIYTYFLLPSFNWARDRNDALVIQFGSMKPSLDYLQTNFGRLAFEFGIEACEKHLNFFADYEGPREMVKDEVWSRMKLKS